MDILLIEENSERIFILNIPTNIDELKTNTSDYIFKWFDDAGSKISSDNTSTITLSNHKISLYDCGFADYSAIIVTTVDLSMEFSDNYNRINSIVKNTASGHKHTILRNLSQKYQKGQKFDISTSEKISSLLLQELFGISDDIWLFEPKTDSDDYGFYISNKENEKIYIDHNVYASILTSKEDISKIEYYTYKHLNISEEIATLDYINQKINTSKSITIETKFKKLLFKFGHVAGHFFVQSNLEYLDNFPDKVDGYIHIIGCELKEVPEYLINGERYWNKEYFFVETPIGKFIGDSKLHDAILRKERVLKIAQFTEED
jgi:hypothetical protein